MTARVPFALVGIVLLVGSATLAVPTTGPVVTEPDVDREMERLTAETASALRDAVTRASREAARNPVVRPADTEYGRVLDGDSPFRDALRLRIYLEFRSNLGAITEREIGRDVLASLPNPDSPEALREAKRRVHLERSNGDRRVRVTVENVTLTVSQRKQGVARRDVSPTVTVPTPVFAVHERVSLYERRLDAGPLKPGLGRRLTGSLYPVVWARGYAQYGGAAIENVLANRHVALFANRAILSIQRDVFGHSDPVGRTVYRRAFTNTALTDVLDGLDTPAIIAEVQDRGDLTPDPADALRGSETLDSVPTPDQTVTVGVNETADRQFLATLEHIDEIIEQTYTAEVELRVRVEKTADRYPRKRPQRSKSWRLLENETNQTVTVGPGTEQSPKPSRGGHVLEFHSRTIQRTTTIQQTWETPDGIRRTRGQHVEEYAVDLTLVCSHSQGPAPVRSIRDVHEKGGPFDGPNLADVGPVAHERLIEQRGGTEALARRAVSGRNVSTSTRIIGDRPDGLSEWVYTDLVGLRKQVANVSVTTTRGKLATFRANPAAKLAARLRSVRSTLLDAPTEYGSVADRTRIGARAAYLDSVIARLETRASDHRQNRIRLDNALASVGGSSIDRLQEGYSQRDQTRNQTAVGESRMRVHAAPAYLTTDPLDSEAVPALSHGQRSHPLVVRNWNAVTLPYGDIADAVVDAILPPDTTRLRSGAQVLNAVERSQSRLGVSRLEPERLREQIEIGVEASERAALDTLSSFDLGNESSRSTVVSRALSEWSGTGGQALAVTNGSAAERIHYLAVDRWSDRLSEPERDRLALRLAANMKNATEREKARPKERPVAETAREFRTFLRDRTSDELGDAIANTSRQTLEGLTGRALSRLPAGLPVAPAPGMWYATVNLWQVRVRGEFERFAVSVPRGTPDDPGGRFLYVRDGSPARIDVDGDGVRERIGWSSRVTFETGTDVAIAVPPGPRGVGDVDGNADERSEGWPTPGECEKPDGDQSSGGK